MTPEILALTLLNSSVIRAATVCDVKLATNKTNAKIAAYSMTTSPVWPQRGDGRWSFSQPFFEMGLIDLEDILLK